MARPLARVSLHRGDGEHLAVDRDDAFWIDYWCDGELCWINAEKSNETGHWYTRLFIGSKYIRNEAQALLDFMSVNECYAGMSPKEMFISLLGAEDGP